jgi:F-type H+-transporting ATPase subunit delta
MLEGKLSRRYGKALFELAAGREEAVAAELDSYLDAYLGSDLNKVLNNPAFDVEDRKKVALEVADQLELSASTRNLIAILVEKERLSYLQSVIAHYHLLLDALRDRVNATLIVPQALDDGKREEMTELVGKLYGKQAVLTEQIDPSIIGGVIIEVGGKVYDGSVRTQLQGLKQNIERTF